MLVIAFAPKWKKKTTRREGMRKHRPYFSHRINNRGPKKKEAEVCTDTLGEEGCVVSSLAASRALPDFQEAGGRGALSG